LDDTQETGRGAPARLGSGVHDRLTDPFDHKALNVEWFSSREQLLTPIMTKVNAAPAALDAHLRLTALADVDSTRFAKAYGFHHLDHQIAGPYESVLMTHV
jgi:hypothetical protein